jgi:hypothetical protein
VAPVDTRGAVLRGPPSTAQASVLSGGAATMKAGKAGRKDKSAFMPQMFGALRTSFLVGCLFGLVIAIHAHSTRRVPVAAEPSWAERAGSVAKATAWLSQQRYRTLAPRVETAETAAARTHKEDSNPGSDELDLDAESWSDVKVKGFEHGGRGPVGKRRVWRRQQGGRGRLQPQRQDGVVATSGGGRHAGRRAGSTRPGGRGRGAGRGVHSGARAQVRSVGHAVGMHHSGGTGRATGHARENGRVVGGHSRARELRGSAATRSHGGPRAELQRQLPQPLEGGKGRLGPGERQKRRRRRRRQRKRLRQRREWLKGRGVAGRAGWHAGRFPRRFDVHSHTSTQTRDGVQVVGVRDGTELVTAHMWKPVAKMPELDLRGLEEGAWEERQGRLLLAAQYVHSDRVATGTLDEVIATSHVADHATSTSGLVHREWCASFCMVWGMCRLPGMPKTRCSCPHCCARCLSLRIVRGTRTGMQPKWPVGAFTGLQPCVRLFACILW